MKGSYAKEPQSRLDQNHPGAHCTHVLSEVAAETSEYLLSPHIVQVALDVAADAVEYFPASQLVHTAAGALV